jgi:hypothetical protein
MVKILGRIMVRPHVSKIPCRLPVRQIFPIVCGNILIFLRRIENIRLTGVRANGLEVNFHAHRSAGGNF